MDMRRLFVTILILSFVLCWWNTSYFCRRKIVVYNPNIYDGENISVLLELNFTDIFGDKVNENYTDIAFTYYDPVSGEEIEIPFIFEGKEGLLKDYINRSEDLVNGIGKIWVKIPRIPYSKIGKDVAGNFSGNGYIAINWSLYGTSISNYTIFIDFLPRENVTRQFIVYIENLFGISIYNGSLELFYYDSSSYSWKKVSTEYNIRRNELYRVSLTFAGGKNITLYINGSKVIYIPISFSSQSFSSGTTSIVGACTMSCGGLYSKSFGKNTFKHFFEGHIYRFLFYDRLLSSDEVTNCTFGSCPSNPYYNLTFSDLQNSKSIAVNVSIVPKNEITPGNATIYVYYLNPNKSSIKWEPRDVFLEYSTDSFENWSFCAGRNFCGTASHGVTTTFGFPSPPSLYVIEASDTWTTSNFWGRNVSSGWYYIDLYVRGKSSTSSGLVTQVRLFSDYETIFGNGNKQAAFAWYYAGGSYDSGWFRIKGIFYFPSNTFFGIGYADGWASDFNQEVLIDTIKIAKSLPGLTYTIFSEETIDNEPPSIIITPNYSNWTNNNIEVTITCKDNYACKKIYYKVVNSSETCPTDISLYSETENSSITIILNNEGRYKICVKAVDLVGNLNSTESGEYRIDKTAPETAASPSSGVFEGGVNITLTCSDSLSGCNKTYYLVTSQSSCPETGYKEYLEPIQISQTGIRYICAYSIDNAGNIEGKKIFGPYYISKPGEVNLTGYAVILTKDNFTQFEAIFYREIIDDGFGFIFRYSQNFTTVFLNNSKVQILFCYQNLTCYNLFEREYSYPKSAIMKISCKNNTLRIVDEGFSWELVYSCDNGKIGFVCKNCKLGAVGVKYY